MILSRNQKRKHFLAALAVISGILIWWAQLADPIVEKLNTLDERIVKLTKENSRLKLRMEKATALPTGDGIIQEAEARRQADLVKGRSLEEITLGIQAIIGELIEKESIAVKSYKDLPPAKWESHQIARIELQFELQTEKLAHFLEAVDDLKKALRIEKLMITSRQGKNEDLLVSVQLGALFVEK